MRVSNTILFKIWNYCNVPTDDSVAMLVEIFII
jgi:hypothetical protein